MRYIPLADQTPPAVWLLKADAALKNLQAAPDMDARKAIIDANSRIWGELKSWLLKLSHDKCWFFEVKDICSYPHVEHYRPKKIAKDEDGTAYEGYWWLAFDWRNFRICGSVPNTSKGTFFPLRTGCQRVSIAGDLRLEHPKLLDPTDEDDPNLLSFDSTGDAIVAVNVQGWDKERVEYSVKRLKLDHQPLVEKRKAVWNACHQRIQAYKTELSKFESDNQNDIARQQIKENARAIRKMLQPDQELSSVARACVLSSGDPRIMGLLQSS